jgi:predicted nucleotidyltransferase
MFINKTNDFITKITEWSNTQPDIAALALVGSHARNTATESSDIDLVVITSLPDKYLKDLSWVKGFGRVDRYRIEDYGKLISVRVWYEAGPEVEYGITDPSWAALPLDDGTREVMAGGMRILFEKEKILSRHQSGQK